MVKKTWTLFSLLLTTTRDPILVKACKLQLDPLVVVNSKENRVQVFLTMTHKVI